MGRVLGIDLGTTNCCAAVMDDGNLLVVPLEGNSYTLASMVGFLPDGRHVLGGIAKRQSAKNAANTVFAAKRLLGRSFDDEQTKRAMQAMPYPCVRGPHGDVRIAIGSREYAIQEISALILDEIRRAAQTHFGEPITDAVITVPAYFNDRQRQATKDAGKIAGLNVLRVVNEPTAAAIAYGLHLGAERATAVFDLGGGTFDVSVLRVGGGVVEVLASAGDAFLGGHDFDNNILLWLLQQIQSQNGIDLSGDDNAIQRLREAAEAAKIKLTDDPTTKIALPFLATSPDGQTLHVDLELTQGVLDALVQELVDRTEHVFRETIKEANLTPEDIQEIVLVGGMTCMPAVRKRVLSIVPCTPATGVHPDLIVAAGAAAHAAQLFDETPSAVLLDVTPHNLGIVSIGGLSFTVVPKNSKLPVQGKRVFTTAGDQQREVKIVAFQGDAEHIDKNEILGDFRLEVPEGIRGQVNIEVMFSIASDGIVTVSATDMATGNAQCVRIEASLALDDTEIQHMADQLKTEQVTN